MDDRKVVDYFVIAGLPPDTVPAPADDLPSIKTHGKCPITDITVIFPALGETVPEGYTVINKTPSGLLADLNHGSLRSPEVFFCYKRGLDKPPLVDIGVMYDGKERILSDSEIVDKSMKGHCANVNNSAAKTFLTFRRATPTMACNSLVVTDVAVIITNKGEAVPHAFCCIKKNLNRGLVGSDVYICYKKSVNRPTLINYKPGILLRYPFENRPNLPLPESVSMFCMPMGCSLEKWPKIAALPKPIFSTFVLTVSDAAEKLYGAAITFYEPYSVKKLTDEQKSLLHHVAGSEDWTYHINKCICLLSRWPFFDTYELFLNFLYNTSRSKEAHAVPIERFITYFLDEIPFPGPQRPRMLVQLSQIDRLILTQPEDLPLPRSGAGFRLLLLHLGPDNCLLLLLCALTEQKILVHSLRSDVLTAVAEAISMIMFPFKWQCPYIPLCPLGLAEVLHAPLPFLIGVDSRFFDLYDPPPEVNCVDLDTNNITFCDEKRNLNIKLLPKKAGRVLRGTLEHMHQKLQNVVIQNPDLIIPNLNDDSIDKEFQAKKKEQLLELEIQEAFLRFMATILRGYRNFLLPITKAPTIGTTDTNSLFDLQGFLRSRDKAHIKFFSLVTKTQMFIRFIEERSFVSDMDAGLAFFDECTEKICYRVMMQLCGLYRLPVIAVLLLMNMKREHLQPNAITYGFYNRAVLEATWPSGMENSSQLLWNKLSLSFVKHLVKERLSARLKKNRKAKQQQRLVMGRKNYTVPSCPYILSLILFRNVIMGAALFKKAGKAATRRRLSTTMEDSLSIADPALTSGSRTSIESGESLNPASSGIQKKKFMRKPLYFLHLFKGSSTKLTRSRAVVETFWVHPGLFAIRKSYD
ncbi:unnamed protein product [Nesidiocoris tenuis]|uniref:UDENN domain-containing protein n=1 Tax=Nesidiocoris tenuis TaxID=355587 RepID=A0A6H5HMF5_9HEMI|nr:unnamed protein product [Nesidiocoris tenuis]